ncbi:bacterial bifunctional deaminase-reductase [Halteromyces radiatus]|uniref:bacterial bifunctional deaminase-reductase n=1 Tax=Halteromyces radiatus TaxID=101107 RepID=UPI00221ED167|nr:bacterial bifunctional deaminase-reductase [Halteromyces radiatus]KAI8099937.1 bacterial bifunctional deaminase-reductase [Halteromyces radiatus]
MYEQAKNFLLPLYQNITFPSNRPLLTLTYAQSIDCKIALKGKPLLLSGKESMAMTHRLRIIHDAILVGSGTACIDDPQLNARHIPLEEMNNQPQPVILDTHLNLPLSCRLLKNYATGQGKQPWIITSSSSSSTDKKMALEKAGAKIFTIQESATGRLAWKDVLGILSKEGIQSVMVEGGSSIIQSCLLSGFVDQLIVTIAPVYVGDQGITVSATTNLENVQYQTFGRDIVMAAHPVKS